MTTAPWENDAVIGQPPAAAVSNGKAAPWDTDTPLNFTNPTASTTGTPTPGTEAPPPAAPSAMDDATTAAAKQMGQSGLKAAILANGVNVPYGDTAITHLMATLDSLRYGLPYDDMLKRNQEILKTATDSAKVHSPYAYGAGATGQIAAETALGSLIPGGTLAVGGLQGGSNSDRTVGGTAEGTIAGLLGAKYIPGGVNAVAKYAPGIKSYMSHPTAALTALGLGELAHPLTFLAPAALTAAKYAAKIPGAPALAGTLSSMSGQRAMDTARSLLPWNWGSAPSPAAPPQGRGGYARGGLIANARSKKNFADGGLISDGSDSVDAAPVDESQYLLNGLRDAPGNIWQGLTGGVAQQGLNSQADFLSGKDAQGNDIADKPLIVPDPDKYGGQTAMGDIGKFVTGNTVAGAAPRGALGAGPFYRMSPEAADHVFNKYKAQYPHAYALDDVKVAMQNLAKLITENKEMPRFKGSVGQQPWAQLNAIPPHPYAADVALREFSGVPPAVAGVGLENFNPEQYYTGNQVPFPSEGLNPGNVGEARGTSELPWAVTTTNKPEEVQQWLDQKYPNTKYATRTNYGDPDRGSHVLLDDKATAAMLKLFFHKSDGGNSYRRGGLIC